MKSNAKKIVRKDNVITKIILFGIFSFPICFVMIVSKANFISEIITSIIFLVLFKQIKKIIEQRISTKPTFNEQYYRDIPNLKPAIAKYYIAKDQYEDIYDFYATILDLINRKYLLLDFETKILSINPIANLEKLHKFEFNVIELLFYKPEKEVVNFNTLKKEIESDELFFDKLDAWKMYVEIEARESEYFYENKTLKILSYISGFIAGITPFLFCFIAPMINITDTLCCMICAIEIACWSLAMINTKKYPEEIVNEIEKSKALARYIKDYSLLNQKSVDTLVIWEGYLVYSIIFDIPKNVKKYFEDIFG